MARIIISTTDAGIGKLLVERMVLVRRDWFSYKFIIFEFITRERAGGVIL